MSDVTTVGAYGSAIYCPCGERAHYICECGCPCCGADPCARGCGGSVVPLGEADDDHPLRLGV